MRQWLGSIAFTLYLFISVPVYGVVVLSTAVLPRRTSYVAARAWVRSVLWLLERVCTNDTRHPIR